jgi:hypothetical protein
LSRLELSAWDLQSQARGSLEILEEVETEQDEGTEE